MVSQGLCVEIKIGERRDKTKTLSRALHYCEEWVRKQLLSSKALLDVLRTYTVMTPLVTVQK